MKSSVKKIRILLSLLAAVMIFGSMAGCSNNSNNGNNGSNKESGNSLSESGEKWPESEMSTIPKPNAKITSVQRLNVDKEIPSDDKTTQPTSVVVYMDGMSKKDAFEYYDKLNAQFSSYLTGNEKSDDKILITGSLDATKKLGFLFSWGKVPGMSEPGGVITIIYYDRAGIKL